MRLMQRLEELLSDVRLAVRQLISARGFTLVARSPWRSASASTAPSSRWPMRR